MPGDTLNIRENHTHSYAPEMHQVQVPSCAYMALPTPINVQRICVESCAQLDMLLLTCLCCTAWLLCRSLPVSLSPLG